MIHFKFRTGKKWQTVDCESPHVSVKDLLNAVSIKTKLHKYMNMGRGDRVRGKKFEPIRLSVVAVRPEQACLDAGLIAKGSYVVLSRLPLHQSESIIHDVHR